MGCWTSSLSSRGRLQSTSSGGCSTPPCSPTGWSCSPPSSTTCTTSASPGGATWATPAAQRPGVGEMPDRLLHQRAQPRLAAVERPLLVSQPVLGAPVPDRGMPVLARLGDAPEAPVEDGGDLSGVQHLAEP